MDNRFRISGPVARTLTVAGGLGGLAWLAAAALGGTPPSALLWPGAGVGLALVLRAGAGVLPGIALGAALGTLLAGTPLAVAAAAALAAVAQAGLGAWLLRRVPDFHPALDRPRDVLALLVLGAALGTLPGALLAAAAPSLAAAVPWSAFPARLYADWAAELTGVLAFAPAALLACSAPARWRARRAAEGVLLLAAVAGLGLAAWPGLSAVALTPYALLLPVLWAVFRFGRAMTAAVIMLSAALAAAGAVGAAELHPFVLVSAVTALLLGALRTQQQRMRRGLAVARSELEHTRESLIEEKDRAQVTLASIGEAVITTDARGRVDFLNPVAETLTGWSLDSARGRPLKQVLNLVDSAPEGAGAGEAEPDPLQSYSVLRRRDGEKFFIHSTASEIRNRAQDEIGTVIVFQDVTHVQRLAQKLSYQATHDELTGLVNRREFERRLERALDGARRDGARHALCFLDLDRFKIVNDQGGHRVGDELLAMLGTVLHKRLRQRDTVGRLGGDEFGVLLEHCPIEQALRVAQDICADVRDFSFVWEGRAYSIGVSIGVTAVSAETESASSALNAADMACYAAKAQGRNRVELHRDEIEDQARHHAR